MFLWRMARCAAWWQWAYLAVLVALVLALWFHIALGLPRMLVGFLAVPAVAMGIGLFFMLDSLRRHAEDPWIN